MKVPTRCRLGFALVLVLTLLLAPAPGAADPVVGAWSEIFDWPIVAIHMAQLHTGEILVWSSKGEEPHLLDPSGDCFDEAGGCFTQKENPVNIFCAGQTHLDDGTIIVNGGHVRNNVGEPDTFLFQYDLETDDWSWTPVGEIEDTDFARWYPTLTTLPDGRVLNVSGSQKVCVNGADAGELCMVHEDCAPAAEENCTAQLIATPELFDPATRTWEPLPLITQSVQFYPFNFVDPDGTVFFAGADVGASGADVPPTQSHVFDVDNETLTPTGAVSAEDGGSAAMYAPGRILKTGGTSGSSTAIADAEIIDLAGAAVWAPTDPMNVPRRRHNLTVLPDGTVLVTGGTRVANREFEIEETCGGTDGGAVCSSDDDCPADVDCDKNTMGEQHWVSEAEIWDPGTGSWTLMAGNQVPRMYHSTALLLPDGRVLSAGGGRGGGAVSNYSNAEIFSPPYLFTGTPRPVIAEAPEIIHYGEVFEVESPEAADVDRVSLIRLAAVTHSFDQNRRFVPLVFSPSGDQELEIDAPSSPNEAPPGWYMLFLLSEEGVPSVARFVRLMPANPGADALFEYTVKVVCGTREDVDESHAPGLYATSVNIHNPGAPRVRFYKKLALTYPPGDQRAGEVIPIGVDALGYDEALQTDCRELRRRAIPTRDAPFIEGFLVVQSSGSLDVTAVYSTAATDGAGDAGSHSSIDVEPIVGRDRHLDLEVTKREDHFCQQINDLLRFCYVLYEVRVENRGPNDAHDVVVEDEATRPGGLIAVVPGIFEVEPGGMMEVGTPVGETVMLTATIPELLAGDTGVVRFWVFAPLYTPIATTPPELEPFVPPTLVNRASATAAEPDRWLGNNTAQVVTNLP